MMKPNELLDEAKTLQPQLQKWRRTIHRNPEVGFDLPKTGGYGNWMFPAIGLSLVAVAVVVIYFAFRDKKKDRFQHGC